MMALLVYLIIAGQNVQILFNTGAGVPLVTEITYERSLAHLPFSPCKMPLPTFSRETTPVLRKGILNVEYAQQPKYP